MCRDCGCGAGSDPAHEHHDHDHHHHRAHAPGHQHHHPEDGRRTIAVNQAVLAKNDQAAARNRQRFRARGTVVLNVLSSPGSGKTALLRRTLAEIGPRHRAGVVVGDLATDNDARRLRETGAPVVQVTTGTVCHLEAEMVARAVDAIGLDDLDLLFIENVGNLVCPASYDLGEDLRVVLLSVTEGEDKPLKYPVAFQGAAAVVVSKIDLAEAAGFDREEALRNIRRAAPDAIILELSARSGRGMQPWYDILEAKLRDGPHPVGTGS